LLAWFAVNGRSFVWREEQSHFRILVAEVLLKQTRAATVEAFYPRFLAVYPDPHALAAALEDDLAFILRPLGFSRQRARHLRALATVLVRDYGGVVPSELAALRELPGIGPYTAGIVKAACFGSDVPAVDTNVARVLCRVLNLAPSHLE